MTVLDSAAAYRLWSATYDSGPNPILALEERVLRERLRFTPGLRVLDLATGTGRWLRYALSKDARGFGVDSSPEMLAQAAGKGMHARLVQATVCSLPFRNDAADLAICSFALGYFQSLQLAFHEMARTSRRVIVSDLHPEAIRAGWARGFRVSTGKYEIASRHHSRAMINDCARAARLSPRWDLEARFEEPERSLFEQAGKGDAFEAARQLPAIFVSCWERS